MAGKVLLLQKPRRPTREVCTKLHSYNTVGQYSKPDVPVVIKQKITCMLTFTVHIQKLLSLVVVQV